MSNNVIIEFDSNTKTAYKACPKKPGVYSMLDKQTGRVVKVLTVCGESKTDQSYKEMTSVKAQVRATEAKGLLRAGTKFEGEMDDFPDYDFQEAQFMMAKAKSTYESLPSAVRNKFETPAEFMQYANNPNNAKEMVELGLAKAIDGKTADGTVTQQANGQATPEAIKEAQGHEVPTPQA